MKKCSLCQFEMNDDAEFCTSCGKTFDQVFAENNQVPPQGQPMMNNQVPPQGQPMMNNQVPPQAQPTVNPYVNNQAQQYGQPMMNNQTGQYNQPMMNNQPPKSKSSTKIILILSAVFIVVAALIVFLVVSVFNGKGRGESSIDNAAKAYINSMADGDYEANLEVTIFECDNDTYERKIDDIEYYNGIDSDLHGVKVSNLKVTDKVEYSKSEIKDVEESINSFHGLKVDVQECYDVTVSFVFLYDGEKEDVDEYLTIAKVDGKWYVLDDYYY